jgi:hypothetical protein
VDKAIKMKAGLYKVDFKTPAGSGAGVVVLENGVIHGGDSMMFYRGTYRASGGKFTVDFVAGKHTIIPGMISGFGHDSATISLVGTNTDTTAIMTGSAKEVPGVTFQAVLALIP